MSNPDFTAIVTAKKARAINNSMPKTKRPLPIMQDLTTEIADLESEVLDIEQRMNASSVPIADFLQRTTRIKACLTQLKSLLDKLHLHE